MDDSYEPIVPEEAEETRHPREPAGTPDLPIHSVLGSLDFSDHFVLLGEVGTGTSTGVPIHETLEPGSALRIFLRLPSRASSNALY